MRCDVLYDVIWLSCLSSMWLGKEFVCVKKKKIKNVLGLFEKEFSCIWIFLNNISLSLLLQKKKSLRDKMNANRGVR